MFAYQPPAVVQQQATDEQTDVIEIVGTRVDEVQKIDRRNYRVNDTPHSQQKNAVQLLRGLPAVTISPEDEISLLGSGNVTIYVDGRPYQGDATQYLRTLRGSDIERIEIITNPSAQYSGEGTGGIINFVLRKKQTEGVSGNAYSEVSSLGHGNAGASFKTKRGKWTYEFETGGRVGTGSRSSYYRLRSIEEAPGGTPTVNTEIGRGSSRGTEGEASAKVSYDIDQRTSVSAKLLGADWRDISGDHADFAGVTPNFESFSERQRSVTTSSYLISNLNFDHKGRKDGETLSASLRLIASPLQRETNAADFSYGGSLATEKRKKFLYGTGQVDWQHPMGKREILSVGGTWDTSHMSEAYRFASDGGDGSLGSDVRDRFSGTENRLAAYSTFQQTIGTWTVMPGLRIEHVSRRISSPGEPEVRIGHTDVFPTLHMEHPLSKTVDLTLSYSKRIDRPPLNDLRPYAIVQDVFTVKTGNPHLKDQSTDSYEVNLHYQRKKIDAGLIVYDRVTRRLWSEAYSTIDAVNFFTPVNAGTRIDRGTEIDIGAPIAKRVKINASVNLFDERAPIDASVGASSEDEFRYTTNATLEWDGADRGKVPGDVAQLQSGYHSPSRQVQLRYFASSFQSLSYTHSFSRTVSLTGTIDHLSHIRHRLLAPLVQEDYVDRSPTVFRLKVVKTFGAAKR